MARFFKPLLGAVALAAATLTSTGAFAAYAYNAQITITAPKGSTAETAAKDKTKPAGVKYSTCAAKISAVTPNVANLDAFNFAIKYDAGKDAAEIGDVYVLFENLSNPVTYRYVSVERTAFGAAGGLVLRTFVDFPALITTGGAATTAVAPFLKATDNLGSGAQTEMLFGGSLALAGLDKGLWAIHTIIAKPGTTSALTGAAGSASTLTSTSFSFGHPETWAAFDTAIFALGSPLPLHGGNLVTAGAAATAYATNVLAANTANLLDYSGGTVDATNTAGSVACQ